MNNGCCIYKYEYEGRVIYIGKTNSDLKGRIKCHAGEYKFQRYLDKANIFYYECKNPAHTTILETYYINKYKPELNSTMKYEEDLDIFIKDVEWIPIDRYFQSGAKCITKSPDRIRKAKQQIKAIYYFYKLYRKCVKRHISICRICNVMSEDESNKIISNYRVYLYFENEDGTKSYHPTIHHCKYNESLHELSFEINQGLYYGNFAKIPKEILKDNRERLKGIVTEQMREENGLVVDELIKW